MDALNGQVATKQTERDQLKRDLEGAEEYHQMVREDEAKAKAAAAEAEAAYEDADATLDNHYATLARLEKQKADAIKAQEVSKKIKGAGVDFKIHSNKQRGYLEKANSSYMNFAAQLIMDFTGYDIENFWEDIGTGGDDYKNIAKLEARRDSLIEKENSLRAQGRNWQADRMRDAIDKLNTRISNLKKKRQEKINELNTNISNELAKGANADKNQITEWKKQLAQMDPTSKFMANHIKDPENMGKGLVQLVVNLMNIPTQSMYAASDTTATIDNAGFDDRSNAFQSPWQDKTPSSIKATINHKYKDESIDHHIRSIGGATLLVPSQGNFTVKANPLTMQKTTTTSSTLDLGLPEYKFVVDDSKNTPPTMNNQTGELTLDIWYKPESTDTETEKGFNAQGPSVTGFETNKVYTPGDDVTISGDNFLKAGDKHDPTLNVLIGGKSAQFRVNNKQDLVATIPSNVLVGRPHMTASIAVVNEFGEGRWWKTTINDQDSTKSTYNVEQTIYVASSLPAAGDDSADAQTKRIQRAPEEEGEAFANTVAQQVTQPTRKSANSSAPKAPAPSQTPSTAAPQPEPAQAVESDMVSVEPEPEPTSVADTKFDPVASDLDPMMLDVISNYMAAKADSSVDESMAEEMMPPEETQESVAANAEGPLPSLLMDGDETEAVEMSSEAIEDEPDAPPPMAAEAESDIDEYDEPEAKEETVTFGGQGEMEDEEGSFGEVLAAQREVEMMEQLPEPPEQVVERIEGARIAHGRVDVAQYSLLLEQKDAEAMKADATAQKESFTGMRALGQANQAAMTKHEQDADVKVAAQTEQRDASIEKQGETGEAKNTGNIINDLMMGIVGPIFSAFGMGGSRKETKSNTGGSPNPSAAAAGTDKIATAGDDSDALVKDGANLKSQEIVKTTAAKKETQALQGEMEQADDTLAENEEATTEGIEQLNTLQDDNASEIETMESEKERLAEEQESALSEYTDWQDEYAMMREATMMSLEADLNQPMTTDEQSSMIG